MRSPSLPGIQGEPGFLAWLGRGRGERGRLLNHVALTLPIVLWGGGRCALGGFGSRTCAQIGWDELPRLLVIMACASLGHGAVL